MPTSTGANQISGLNAARSEDSGLHLHEVKTSGTMTISAELFEKLYLTPKTAPIGDFRKRFANPTPLGFTGFVISALTYAVVEMGWGGATSLDSVVGIFYFTGPVLLLLASVFEWVMGNFFSMIVMGMFAVFWLSFGVLETPAWGIAASYSVTGDVAQGEASIGYNAGVALYLIIWGFWLFTMFIFTLKTNVVTALIFLGAFTGCFIFSGSHWKVSTGDHEVAMRLQKAGGAVFFVLAILGYYMTVVMIAAEMRITIKLPVGDLSHFWLNSEAELADLEKAE